MYKAAAATASPVGAGVFYFCLVLYVPGELTGMTRMQSKLMVRRFHDVLVHA